MKPLKVTLASIALLLAFATERVFPVPWPSNNFRKSRVSSRADADDGRFQVHLAEGETLIREDNGSLQLQSGERDLARTGASFFCRKGSKLLLACGEARFRFLGETTFSCGDAGIVLSTGALLADWRTRGILRLESFDTKLQVSGKCVLFAQATTNGGLKLIDLAGKATVKDMRASGRTVNLSPGELVFAKTNGKGFSDKLNVNLKTLVATSALIHEFPDSRHLRRDLAKTVLEQEPLIRKRYRAVVGDARTPDTFDIRELPSSSEDNGSKSAD